MKKKAKIDAISKKWTVSGSFSETHEKMSRKVENDEKWSNNGKKAKVDEKSRKLIGFFVRRTLENVKKGGKWWKRSNNEEKAKMDGSSTISEFFSGKCGKISKQVENDEMGEII
jgi:hypothetical protein